jgi:hypothetical protein
MTPRGTWLLIGDLAVLTLFVISGRRTHDEATGFLAALEVARTAAPFYLGWLVAAPIAGALREPATATVAAMLTRTSLAWALAFPIAAVGRALLIGRSSPWTFYLVAAGVTLGMLLLWRLAFLFVAWRLHRGARRAAS